MDPDCELMERFEKEKGHTEKVWVFRKPLIISFCFLTISYVIILALFITVSYKVSTLSLKVNHLEIPRNNTADINILDLKTLNEMRSNASEIASKLRKLETSTKNTTGVSLMDLVNKLNEVRSNDTTGVSLMDLVNKLNEVRSNVSEIASKLRELENSTKTATSGTSHSASIADLNELRSNVAGLALKLHKMENASKKASCESGWLTFGNNCYYFSSTKSDWMKARDMCMKNDSDLVVINNKEEQDFISERTSSMRYWIGLSDLDDEGVWTWVDGTDYEKSFNVCKRWKRLVMDRTLWRHVDLTSCKLNSKIIWHLLRHWLGSGLQTLMITGFLHTAKKSEFLTTAVFLELEKRFPSLETLSLRQTNFRSVNYDSFPSTLKSLELIRCEVPMLWFQPSPGRSGRFPKLETLILNEVPSFSSYHLETICSHSDLKTLLLSGTYRVTDIGVQQAAPHLKHLKHLKLQGCNITDLSMHLIGKYLMSLRTLDLRNVCTLTEVGLASLSNLKTLEKLWLEYCCSLYSSSIISVCTTLPSLNHLHLNGTFEGHYVDIVQKSLPNCRVTNTLLK
ncbi:F-box/LRR-repeat protein 12 isoform X3 [Bombina bombina]|uniref:F-box/LRR-repeat protein 12 isoform X3 n=1 Tax=Bombina bombina TaxID=8345 RepID=UPI00235B0ADB|nr:F-box/LRR-repeat protein 12 isoform X3 [Bombina bombina]